MADYKTVNSSLKTQREKFAAPFVPADYDRAVFTSEAGLPATVDAIFTSLTALGANMWAVQRRMWITETLLEKNGKVTREMIEQYQPTAEEAAMLRKTRNAFVAEIYDPFRLMGDIQYGKSIDVPNDTVKKAL